MHAVANLQMAEFQQAIVGLERDDLIEIRRSLENRLTDLKLSIDQKEIDGSPISRPLTDARNWCGKKLAVINKALAEINANAISKLSQSYHLIYRGRWRLTRHKLVKFLVEDILNGDEDAPSPEGYNLTEEEYNRLKDFGLEEVEP